MSDTDQYEPPTGLCPDCDEPFASCQCPRDHEVCAYCGTRIVDPAWAPWCGAICAIDAEQEGQDLVRLRDQWQHALCDVRRN